MKKRIEELETLQQGEVKNDFANGELWNECQDKLANIHMYGQEADVEPLMIDGYVSGYILENGQVVYYEGMNFDTID
mgnify:CR=1 FL=1|tara:strand:- start:111 stop:341 length:231 start_codon:yes stop_codon:yes gene_type:complete